MNEKDWIFYLKKFLYEKEPVLKSVNEDCAVIKISKSKYLLLTTDALVENVHFKLKYTSYFNLGIKLAVSNLSDIAAMGGEPKWALLTLGSPYPVDLYWVEPFMKGIVSTLNRYGAFLVGGDTVRSSTLFVNLTLIGETTNPILRKGAKEGDLIFVSKPLGESAAFLRFIKKRPLNKIPYHIQQAHLTPEPEINLGKELSRKKLATSMIDISDGLLLDLWRICEENNLGAELYREKIPVGKNVLLKEALTGGEDYALLFTLDPANLSELYKTAEKLKKTVFQIGKTISQKELYLIYNNRRKKLKPSGFDHFSREESP